MVLLLDLFDYSGLKLFSCHCYVKHACGGDFQASACGLSII